MTRYLYVGQSIHVNRGIPPIAQEWLGGMVMKSATDKSLGRRNTQMFWALLNISDPVEGKKIRSVKENKMYVYFKG